MWMDRERGREVEQDRDRKFLRERSRDLDRLCMGVFSG
jgi:hypothetical protein